MQGNSLCGEKSERREFGRMISRLNRFSIEILIVLICPIVVLIGIIGIIFFQVFLALIKGHLQSVLKRSQAGDRLAPLISGPQPLLFQGFGVDLFQRGAALDLRQEMGDGVDGRSGGWRGWRWDRKSTRLNSS